MSWLAVLLALVVGATGPAAAHHPPSGSGHHPHHHTSTKKGRRPAVKKKQHKKKATPKKPVATVTAPASTVTGPAAVPAPADPAPADPAPDPSAPVPPPTDPTPAPPLPARTGVDLAEYSVNPAYRTLAAGPVELNADNFGMDDHDLTVVAGSDRHGAYLGQVFLHPGETKTLDLTLPAGTYTLFCSLYGGTHDAAGMHATLTVK